jgi:hypothetical protein
MKKAMGAERRQENFDSRAAIYAMRRLSMRSIHGVRESTTKWKWANHPQILIPAYSAGRTAIAKWPNSGAASIRGYIGCLAWDRFSIFYQILSSSLSGQAWPFTSLSSSPNNKLERQSVSGSPGSWFIVPG